MVEHLGQKWWTLVLRGIAAVIFGILAFAWPGLTYIVLMLLFGAYALVDGVFALIGAFRTGGGQRWALALEGVVGVLAGLVTLFWTGAAAIALLFVIAAWAILTGVLETIAAIRLREEIEHEWLLLLGGLLSVLFGIFIAIQPAAGLLAVTWMIGAYGVVFGILLIALGIRMRGWHSLRGAAA